jgi:hypothetical protein
MRRSRTLLAVLLACVWALAAPLAMASNNCMVMGALCEGPCGASSSVVSGPVSVASVQLLTTAEPLPAEHVPQVALKVSDPPPKPLFRSA